MRFFPHPEKDEAMVQKRGDGQWTQVLEAVENGERERMEAAHTWQNHKAGAGVLANSSATLSALDNYLQTLFTRERKKLLTYCLEFSCQCNPNRYRRGECWKNKQASLKSMKQHSIYRRQGGFSGGSVVKNLPAYAGDRGDVDSIPGLGRSPEERSGYPLQYSCLGNSMDRVAWWATVHGVTKGLCDWVHIHAHNPVLESLITCSRAHGWLKSGHIRNQI